MPAIRRRPGAAVAEVEDAMQGKIPSAFSEESNANVETLNISESLTLLRSKLEDPDRSQSMITRDAGNNVLQKTVEYLENFSRYKDLETVKQLRGLTMEHKVDAMYDEEGNATGSLALSGFERAQLANLAVETVEEAKNLIPTLETKDDDKLQLLIDELSNLRKFQA